MPEFNESANHRQRSITPVGGKSHEIYKITGTNAFTGLPFENVVSESEADLKYSGTQITASEGHQIGSIGKTRDDVGGPFFSQKQSIYGVSPVDIAVSRPGGFSDWINHYKFSGPLLPVTPGPDGELPFPPSHLSSDDELDALGATAVANTNPENAFVRLSSTIGELFTSGLPALVGHQTWRGKTLKARNAGKEYLNVQFGWVPLVSDISDFADVVRNADAVLAQYERDAGKRVRRRYEISSVEKSEVPQFHTGVYPYSGTGLNFVSNPGVQKFERKISQRTWFSGAYTYYLPTGYDSRNKLARYALLAQRLGLDPSPEDLWELAPWSWAVDWFSNTGDVIQNVTSFQIDGTVLAYGYVMEHTIVTDTYTLEGVEDINHDPIVVPSLTLVTETKVRQVANPYGFGVSWDGLSTFQASILAALGLTKGRRR